MPAIRFTPGPWVVATRPEVDGELMPDGSGGCSYTGRREYDRDLGVCTREDLEQGEYDPEPLARPWLEADAHLIAAAPDLYEALSRVADWLGDRCDHGVRDGTEECRLWSLARAALGKAEGEARGR